MINQETLVFAEAVDARATEITAENLEREREWAENQANADRENAETARQQQAREAREQRKEGYTPEEVWGEDSEEAKLCNDFLAYMAEHDYPGANQLVQAVVTPAKTEFRRRLLKKSKVEVEPAIEHDVWSVRGYGIGFTPFKNGNSNERRDIDYKSYPYSECSGPVRQDIFLCEDGFIREFSDGNVQLLASEDARWKPDMPRKPLIGAVTDSFWGVGGGIHYSVADSDLKSLLVQIATHHTKIETQPQA